MKLSQSLQKLNCGLSHELLSYRAMEAKWGKKLNDKMHWLEAVVRGTVTGFNLFDHFHASSSFAKLSNSITCSLPWFILWNGVLPPLGVSVFTFYVFALCRKPSHRSAAVALRGSRHLTFTLFYAWLGSWLCVCRYCFFASRNPELPSGTCVGCLPCASQQSSFDFFDGKTRKGSRCHWKRALDTLNLGRLLSALTKRLPWLFRYREYVQLIEAFVCFCVF